MKKLFTEINNVPTIRDETEKLRLRCENEISKPARNWGRTIKIGKFWVWCEMKFLHISKNIPRPKYFFGSYPPPCLKMGLTTRRPVFEINAVTFFQETETEAPFWTQYGHLTSALSLKCVMARHFIRFFIKPLNLRAYKWEQKAEKRE